MAAGMSGSEAARKAALFGLASAHTDPPDWAWFVPGRIELLGKHTDYAGGRSLLCATEQGFCFTAKRRSDAEFRVRDVTSGAEAAFSLATGPPAQPAGWQAYPAAVVRRLQRDFGITHGADLAFASDLPPAAGLSSSTALCIGCFLVLWQANQLGEIPANLDLLPDLFRLADYLGAVENGRPYGPFPGDAGVGTLGGSQDQTAILGSLPGEVVQFSFIPVRFERRVSFPSDHLLAVGSSGVIAEKSGAARDAYNAASEATVELLRRWRAAREGRSESSLAAVLASAPDARQQLAQLVEAEPVLLARLTQFAVESEELVPKAGAALLAGDLAEFGAVVERSHGGAHAGLANQTVETLHLALSARRFGAAAASAFGAGFGGSVWALVHAGAAAEFLTRWEQDYLERFPERRDQARFLLTRAGPPARAL